MNSKTLTSADIDQLARVDNIPEDQINTTDIPEAPAENWIHARRGEFYRPRKEPVTIRLDADVLAWFKDHAASGGYQTEINRVLRRYVQEAEKQHS